MHDQIDGNVNKSTICAFKNLFMKEIFFARLIVYHKNSFFGKTVKYPKIIITASYPGRAMK